MIDRLILPMSNVCVAALREGIVDNADTVDGAMIFGTGYAPFRGGPLNYARTPRAGECAPPPCARWRKSSATVHAGYRLGYFQISFANPIRWTYT